MQLRSVMTGSMGGVKVTGGSVRFSGKSLPVLAA